MEGDFQSQNVLLELCCNRLDDNDCKNLTGNVTKIELWNVIKALSTGKVPGIDGLPSEFYKECWEVIKDEFFEVIRYILENQKLSKFQNEGVLKLLRKGNDDPSLSGWRPISLLNVDYETVAYLNSWLIG